MKISLLSDAPRHNLALMQLSAYHKGCGDRVTLNMSLFPADYTYASVLFERNRNLFIADEYGGPAFNNSVSPYSNLKPDYNLYPHNDFSIGYTFRPCFNTCGFCKVPKMNHPDIKHHSIWEFHDPKFKKICLLNNNTFFDKHWKETFGEIWDANLTVMDENGYDLRLLDDEKAEALKKTKFDNKLHFAWDRMKDEKQILNGLGILKKHKINNTHIYVLIGFNTTLNEDIHRCQKLIDFGHDPYIMPYKKTKQNRDFKRFIDTFMWRKYKTIEEAWKNYK